jgi:hypothetical protein
MSMLAVAVTVVVLLEVLEVKVMTGPPLGPSPLGYQSARLGDHL